MDRPQHRIAVAAGLLVLTCLVQAMLIRRATVPGLDAVRFVESAQRIDTDGLIHTAQHQQEQPLFATWLWLVHEGLERSVGPFRSSWAASAQLAAAIPLVLAIVPIYFLSIRLVGPAAALAGSVLFCVLPEVSRLGADGLSDSTHLFFFALAFWAMVVYLTRPADRPANDRDAGPSVATSRETDTESRPPLPCPAPPWAGDSLWLFAAGVLVGLALLVRAEAIVLPAALVATLVAFQFQVRRRQPWLKLAGALGCLALGAAVVQAPYLVAVGATSPDTAAQRLLGRHEVKEPESPRPTSPIAAASVWLLDDAEPMSFATKDPTTSLRRRGYTAATVQFAEELAAAFAYLVGALALFGVWRLRPMPARPVDRFAQVYFLLFSAAVIQFASQEGYVGARHLLTLVVVGIGCAGYGTLAAGQCAATWKQTRGNAECERRLAADLRGSRWAPAMVLAAAMICLIETAEPLHASRAGHRLAAEWLAVEAEAPGPVLDTRGWTALYSGRPTYRYDNARAAFCHPRLAYVVVERRELERESRRCRSLKRLLEVAARPVAEFPGAERINRRQRPVIVYRWDAGRFARWVAGTSDGLPSQENRHARARLRFPPERI